MTSAPEWSRTKGYGYRADGSFDGEAYRLACALVAVGRAVRERYECGAMGMECGGVCHRPIGHDPPCYCLGVDEDGEETCPA